MTTEIVDKYKFSYVMDIFGDHNDMYTDMLDWCQKNATGYYSIDTEEIYDEFYGLHVILHNEKDAMLFKLQYSHLNDYAMR